MRNKLLSLCMVMLLLAVLPLTAFAHEFDPGEKGSISVSLVSRNGNATMVGAELSIFHIASVECSNDGNLLYNFTDEFENSGFQLDDVDLVDQLDSYVTEHSIDCRKIVTDSRGYAVCENLPLGLYFVKQTGAVEGYANCTSFLVAVPVETDDGYAYNVDASPKVDVNRMVSITIEKRWNVDKATQISDEVTVQLLRNQKVIKTVTLNDGNDWKVIYVDMPESDAYSIKEINVPKGFVATYSENGYHFVVTNTSSLIQTGQIVWPIPVFALVGMAFLMLGFVILRKPGKKNA